MFTTTSLINVGAPTFSTAHRLSPSNLLSPAGRCNRHMENALECELSIRQRMLILLAPAPAGSEQRESKDLSPPELSALNSSFPAGWAGLSLLSYTLLMLQPRGF
jgi:hypothetical protein